MGFPYSEVLVLQHSFKLLTENNGKVHSLKSVCVLYCEHLS
jgi:hypothetical protein